MSLFSCQDCIYDKKGYISSCNHLLSLPVVKLLLGTIQNTLFMTVLMYSIYLVVVIVMNSISDRHKI